MVALLGEGIMKISCIIMASGMSKRMGNNKLTLKLNGKMVFEYILDLVKGISFDEIIVVTRFDEIINYSEKLGFKVVINNKYYLGQSESIRLGTKAAKVHNDYMFFVADQPSLSIGTVNDILKEHTGLEKEIIIPYYKGKKGNPILFNNFYRKDLLNLKNDQGGSVIVKENTNHCKVVEIFNDENDDIDCIEDYERIRGIYEK